MDEVLITRPEPGASETATRIAAMGLVPIVAPLLEIRPMPIRPPPGRIAAILLASGNAAGPLPAALHGLPVLTVGSATARRAEQAGFANVASADGDAMALAALVRARFMPRDGTLLLAAGLGREFWRSPPVCERRGIVCSGGWFTPRNRWPACRTRHAWRYPAIKPGRCCSFPPKPLGISRDWYGRPA